MGKNVEGRNLKIGSLFSGIGGLDLGLERGLSDFNAETVWQIEYDEYCCSVLEKRFPNSKVLNKDINEVDFTKLEPVDMLIGGFPCQTFSYAGSRKGMSEEDERGMLWYQFERAISELRPKWVVAENVRGLLTGKDNEGNRGGAFARVISFLSSRGYSVEWQVISAASVNASHLRERIFIVGNSEHYGLLETERRGSFGERTLSWGQIQEEQEKKHRKLAREQETLLNSEGEPSLETNKQASSLSESRQAWIDSRTGHGRKKSKTYWETLEQSMDIPTYGVPPGLAGRLGLPNYWSYNIESQPQTWQTPLVSTSRPSTKRIAEGKNPKGQLSENPKAYLDEYISEPWETVPRTVENEENRVNKIKALGNAVVPACAEFVGICIANSLKFGTLVFDSRYLTKEDK